MRGPKDHPAEILAMADFVFNLPSSGEISASDRASTAIVRAVQDRMSGYGIYADDLAYQIGLSPESVAAWLTGEKELDDDAIEAICDALQIDREEGT